MNEEGTPVGSRVTLPIEWNIPEGLATRYANNIVVQRTEHEYFISFFEVPPPIVLGTPDDVVRQLQELGGVKAVCVARVAVAIDRFPDFVRVMQGHIARAQKAQGEG